MLTISTADLLGILGDVIPFISPDKDDIQRRCVHLRWDGTMLHASATDQLRIAVSSWHPDDDPDHDVQPQIGVVPGEDHPTTWRALLSADDVNHLLKSAKPIKGLEDAPIFVTVDEATVVVERHKQPRLPGMRLTFDCLEHDFPDLRASLVEAAGHAEPVKEIAWNAVLMAAFAQVRQRGHAARWTFTGDRHPAVVEIGNRFVGSITTISDGRRRKAAA